MLLQQWICDGEAGKDGGVEWYKDGGTGDETAVTATKEGWD